MNPISGAHAFEGAYISETWLNPPANAIDADSDNPAAGGRFLEVTLTGSAEGKSCITDDQVEWVCMEQNGQTVHRSLVEAFSKGDSLFGEADMSDWLALSEQRKLDAMPDIAQRLQLILKCLLYIGMKDVRTQVHSEGTQARKAVARAVSGAHKRKAARTAAKTYDTILVLPPVAEAPGAGDAGASGTVATHWRKGFFRSQAHGPKLSLRHTIWIKPVLVNAAALASLADAPPTKQYHVR